MTTCKRCNREWVGDAIFVTCPECRLRDVPKKKQKRGCIRFGMANNKREEEVRGRSPSPWVENNVRHLEDG